MFRLSKTLLSTVMVTAGLVLSPVMAQQPPAAAPSAPMVMQPTDAQLQKFIQAAEKVALVAESYQPKLQSSADEQSRQQVIQAADQEMTQQVTASGLSIEEYIGISEAVQQDPQLRQRAMNLANTPR